MGEYSDRVKAEIVSDNVTRKFLYAIFAVITVVAVFLLGGFATLVAVLGLGPVLVLIVVIEIYCRIQNWRRLRAAEDADADLDKLPKVSTDAVDVIYKLRSRTLQAQRAGEPYLAADLRLAGAMLERLDREAALARRQALGAGSRLSQSDFGGPVGALCGLFELHHGRLDVLAPRAFEGAEITSRRRFERCSARQVRPAPLKETSDGIDSDYRCVSAAVWRRWRILGSQSRLLVTVRVPALWRQRGREVKPVDANPANQ